MSKDRGVVTNPPIGPLSQVILTRFMNHETSVDRPKFRLETVNTLNTRTQSTNQKETELKRVETLSYHYINSVPYKKSDLFNSVS